MIQACNDFVVAKFLDHTEPYKATVIAIGNGADFGYKIGDSIIVTDTTEFTIDGVKYIAVRSCDIVSRVVAG